MLSRHLNELMMRLERVADIGSSEIRHKELTCWYGQERTTVTIWRDLQSKWEEVLESVGEEDIPLLVGESDGIWVFAWGEGLATSEKSWLQDVRRRGNPKSEEAANQAA